MRSRRTISIPAPIAQIDDLVHIRNYRCLTNERWLTGYVKSVSYKQIHTRTFDWQYSVHVDGYPWDFYVGDHDIRLAAKEKP